MITGIEAIGDVPGLKSVASTQIAPASASARAGGRCSPPISSAPGSSTAAHSEAASGATSSGCMRERWSTERAPQSSATGTERMRGELLHVRAQRPAGRPRHRAHARQVLVAERDRLDEDVERVDVARAGERLRLVHPGVGRRARRHRVREQPREAHRLPHAAGQRAPEPRRARLALAREPVAGLALERGRPVLRASPPRAPPPGRAPPRRRARPARAPSWRSRRRRGRSPRTARR